LAHEDLLLTLAEIAITLAALSGVAGILGARPGDTQISTFERLLLRNVALIGMVVTGFSLVPLTFRGSGVADVTVWRLCSALALACWLAGYALFLRRAGAPLRSGAFPLRVFSLGLALNLAGVVLLGWNVLAPGADAARRYALALMCALALAGINFVITALRPGPPAS
jgi:hypothetical protein